MKSMTHPQILRAEKYGSPTYDDMPDVEYRCDACGDLHTKLYECNFCRKEICIVCYGGAAEEVQGGLNVRDTGWNCCYICAENSEIQEEILTEAVRLACGKAQRTGDVTDLSLYLNLRMELRKLCESEVKNGTDEGTKRIL